MCIQFGKSLLVGTIAIGLAACGSGGGDNTATASDVGYTGATEEVSLSDQNSADIVAAKTLASAMSFDLGSLTTDFMAYRLSTAASPTTEPGLAGITQGLIDRTLSLSGTADSGKLAGATQTDTYYCNNDTTGSSGTITITVNQSDPNATTPSAGDSFSLTADSCNEGGRTLMGGFSFVINSYSQGSISVRATYSRMKISENSNGDYLLINGGFTLAATENASTGAGSFSLSGDALLLEERRSGTVEQHALTNFSFVDTIDASHNFTADHDYTFYSTDIGGFVTVNTTTPFFVYANDDYPSSGVLVITCANGASVRVTAIDNTLVQFEYDLDGDGTYSNGSDPAPKQVSWSTI